MPADSLTIDFWDVGQGNCSVVRLPDVSLVVIDVGPRTSPLIDWLNEFPRAIRAVAITHNDEDHAGAIPSIVNLGGVSIQHVYMLQDRDKHSKQFQKVFRPAREQEKLRKLKIDWLKSDLCLWESPDKSLVLKAVYPGFAENIESASPNHTSAIVCLFHRDVLKIVWPGDAPMEVIAEKCGNTRPFILDGPHHGGAC